MEQYLPVLVMVVLGVLFAGLSFVASGLLAPRVPTLAKRAPYECGIVPSREPPERFPVKFYLVAMIFIMFDVEIIFLFPWAVIAGELGSPGFWAVLLFSVIFYVSFLYELAMGGLEWGPIKRSVRADPARSPWRTSETTIRRVGLEGRELEPADGEVAA